MPATIRLRTEEAGRKATWLELLYDLVYVVVIARLVHSLVHHAEAHLNAADLVEFIALFIPVWWAWTGHTLFANRFDPEDTPQRLLTLAQIFCLMLLAGTVERAFTDGSFRFALCYAMVRGLLVVMYLRVYRLATDLRYVTRPFLIGFSAGVSLWLISLLFTGPIRFGLWGVALLVDFVTPMLSREVLSKISVHKHHLPERLGLLTIILLGESVASLVAGLEHGEWQKPLLLAVAGAFVLLGSLWWLYFETLETLIVDAELKAAQLAIYGHAVIYAGLACVATAMLLCIKGGIPATDTSLLLIGGIWAVLVPLLAICYPLLPPPHNRRFAISMVALLLVYLGLYQLLRFTPLMLQALSAALPLVLFIFWHGRRGYLATCRRPKG